MMCLDSHASLQCHQIFSQSPIQDDLLFVRYGRMPIRGRLVSGPVKDSAWVAALLGRNSDTNNPAWDFRISLQDSMRVFEFPMFEEIRREAAEKETTKNASQKGLEFVYSQFAKELAAREVFTEEFIEQLRQEDQARLEENLTFWVAYDNSGGIAGAWGIYSHPDGPFEGKIEIIRTASQRKSPFSLVRMLPMLTEYLHVLELESGTLVMRTDKRGSQLFQSYGAKIVEQYDQGRKFVLEISINEFMELYPAPDIENGSRPLRLVRFLDENFIH